MGLVLNLLQGSSAEAALRPPARTLSNLRDLDLLET